MNKGNPDRPLTINELAEKYPKVVRRLSNLNTVDDNSVECNPQSGEQTRFGVFFHALSDLVPLKDLGQGWPTVVFPTEELPECCRDKELVDRGVLIFPSAAYQFALVDLQRSDSSLKGFGLDIKLNHKWIVLDEATSRRLEMPILSVPTKLIINKSKLIR